MKKIPSLPELFKSKSNPAKWRDIKNEHQIIKTVENTEELVAVNKKILDAQIEQSSAFLEQTNNISTELYATNKNLIGVKDELQDLRKTIINYGEESVKVQYAVKDALNKGFYQIHEGLTIVSNLIQEVSVQQERQVELLTRLYDTVSKKYEALEKELLDEANTILKHALKKADRNQSKNLEDAFGLFSQILENPIGKGDYFAWFEIGYLNWKFKDQLDNAIKAFDQAQRLSDIKGDVPFYIKSIRHLALMHFLKKDYESAYQSITEGILKDNHHTESFYECTIYASRTNRFDIATDCFLECLKNDSLLFARFLSDPDTFQLKNRDFLINHALDIQRKFVVKFKKEVVDLIQKTNSYRSYINSAENKKMLEQLDQIDALLKQDKYVTLREKQLWLEKLFEHLIADNERFLSDKITALESELTGANKERLQKVKNHKEELKNIKLQRTRNLNKIKHDYSMTRRKPKELFKGFFSPFEGEDGCGCLAVIVVILLAGLIYLMVKVYGWFEMEKWWYSVIATILGLVVIIGAMRSIIISIYGSFYSKEESRRNILKQSESKVVEREFEQAERSETERFRIDNLEFLKKENELIHHLSTYNTYLLEIRNLQKEQK